MKRFFLAAALAALTLIAVSPLLRAAPAKPRVAAAPARVAPAPKTTAAKTGKGTKVVKTTKKTVTKVVKTASGKPLGKYAKLKAKRLARGKFCYAGAVHRCWTKRFYSASWRLWFVYDPNTDDWYYWHPTLRTYLPLSYLLSRTPTLPGANVTPQGALKNTVPMDVSNVQEANAANGPKNVPNVPDNVTVNPVE
jgi:hypothetical protein